MQLTNNEQVLKEWKYAKTKQGKALGKKDKNEYTLYITNKRVVSESEGTFGKSKYEIPLQNIQGVQLIEGKKSNFWPIMAMIFSFIVLFPFFLWGLHNLNRCAIYVAFSVSASPLQVCGISKGIVGVDGKIRVSVDKNAAEDIVNSIGAYIIDAQNA